MKDSFIKNNLIIILNSFKLTLITPPTFVLPILLLVEISKLIIFNFFFLNKVKNQLKKNYQNF